MKIHIFDQLGIHEAGPDDLAGLLASPDRLFWVDMVGPTADHIQIMQDVFHFHPLAIEDTHNQKQRPKMEDYDGTFFFILNTISGRAGRLEIQEVDTFIGPNFIVTVHAEAGPIIAEAHRRVARSPRALTGSSHHLFYTLVDTIVDNYFPVLDAIEADIEALGDDILIEPDRNTLNRLFELKRDMTDVWRVVWPQREVISMVMRQRDIFETRRDLEYYLRDVVDHLMWIADMINTLRDTLTSMMDLYMSATSNRLNIVVNRLTVITIGIGIMTVFSGFYGMNFAHTWPPLDAAWAIPAVIIMMLIVLALLFGEFKRRDWF